MDEPQGSKSPQKEIDIEKSLKLNIRTKIGENRDVWFTFQFLEMIIGTICLGYHINGTLYTVEPQPHTVYFCGTFVGFLIISIFSQIRMLLGATSPPLMESVIALFASIAYYFSAFASMYHAEKDFHLMYLSDEEEANHEFFVICKSQSISSLVCGSIYLLHAVYAIDSCIIRDQTENGENNDELKFSPTGPIKLHLFYRPWLEKIKFFRHFYARIETLEAVAIWKRTQYKDTEEDDNLGPGINIYAFEEPIEKKSKTSGKIKSKSKYIDEKVKEIGEEMKSKNTNDKIIQVGEEDLDNLDQILVKSYKKKK